MPLHALCFCSLPRQPARKQGIGASHPLRRPQTPPLLLEQAFQPKFCACFERMWFWAPMELSSRQDLAHWGENPALHLPVLLAQLRSLPVGFGQRDTLVLLDASSRPSLGRTEAPEPLGVSSRLGQPLAPSPARGSSLSCPALCSASSAPVTQEALEARQNCSGKKSSHGSGGKRYYPALPASLAVGR